VKKREIKTHIYKTQHKDREIKTHIYKTQHKDILMINNDNDDNNSNNNNKSTVREYAMLLGIINYVCS
jgi:hypothetical protein